MHRNALNSSHMYEIRDHAIKYITKIKFNGHGNATGAYSPSDEMIKRNQIDCAIAVWRLPFTTKRNVSIETTTATTAISSIFCFAIYYSAKTFKPMKIYMQNEISIRSQTSAKLLRCRFFLWINFRFYEKCQPIARKQLPKRAPWISKCFASRCCVVVYAQRGAARRGERVPFKHTSIWWNYRFETFSFLDYVFNK